MAERSAEVLDDLRQKRLAYFQSQVSSSRNKLTNAQDGNPEKCVSTLKESSVPKRLDSPLKNESSSLDLNQSRGKSTNPTMRSNGHLHHYAYTSSFEENADNISLNQSASADSNNDQMSRHKPEEAYVTGYNQLDNTTSHRNTTSYHKAKGEKDEDDTEKVPVQGADIDGYNETVERLIRATKDELLGKKSTDDIWQRIRKTSDTEIPVKSDENENHKFCVKSIHIDNRAGYDHEREESICKENNEDIRVKPDNNSIEGRNHISRDSNEISAMSMVENLNHSGSNIQRENNEIQTNQDIKHIPVPSKSTFEPSTRRQKDHFESHRESYDSATVEAIFSSRQTHWSVAPDTNLNLQESKDLETITEKKVEESLNLSELGLSTHRPDTDSVRAADLNLGDSITVELRTVLGEEKFQAFLAKAKREIDDLQETRSDRSVRKEKTPRLLKESISSHKQPQSFQNGESRASKTVLLNEKQKSSSKDDPKFRSFMRQTSEPNNSTRVQDSSRRQTTRQISSADPRERQGSLSNRSSDFTPRQPAGETVSSIIGEFVLDNRESNGPSSSNQVFTEKLDEGSSRAVPELNLSEIIKSDSPRPKLNRPKHEPFNIYQDRTKSQDIKRSDREHSRHDPAVNYEQVPVAKNVMFSADEIYSKAYGSLYHSHSEMQVMSPHSYHGSLQYSIQSSGQVLESGPVFTIPLTPTTPIFSVTKATQPTMTSQVYSGQTGKHAEAVSNFQHYNSTIARHPTHPVDKIQIPHPPFQAFNQPPLQHNRSQDYGNVYDTMQEHRGNPMQMTRPFTDSLPMNEMVTHIPHPPEMLENSRPSKQNMELQARQPIGYSTKWEEHSNKWNGHTHKREEPMIVQSQTPTSNVEVQTDDLQANGMDKVTLVEESAFTSVSQIHVNDVKVPHPPPTKKSSRPSPRKPIKGQDASRHIDGIRQHHEQRRQEQEDAKLTDEEILARQRKFAKASLDRYFTSLENLYLSPKPNPSDVSNDILKEADDENDRSESIEDTDEKNEEFDVFKENKTPNAEAPDRDIEKVKADHQSWTEGYNEGYRNAQMKQSDVQKSLDDETVVNSEVTGVTLNAGGVTERLESMGVHVSHSEEVNTRSGGNVDEHQTKKHKQGKKLLICPECEGLNKEYMSWCTHCGEMLIGVEPKLVSKTRDGKLRIKPVTENKDQLVNKLNTLNINTQSVEVNYIQEIADKPFSLNLDELKCEERDVLVGPKNTSPIKSDGKDSGRPSSEDRDNDTQGHPMEAVNVNTETVNEDLIQEPNVAAMKPHVMQETVRMDRTDTLKEQPTIMNNLDEPNKNFRSETVIDTSAGDAMTVAERVKQIESVKEVGLKNRIDSASQFKNTPRLKGDLAMDSIGASYLIMSKKHDLIKESLGIDENDESRPNMESRTVKKSYKEKEGLTSVFELTAEKTNSHDDSLSIGHSLPPKQSTHNFVETNALTTKPTSWLTDKYEESSAQTINTQNPHGDVKPNRQNVSADNSHPMASINKPLQNRENMQAAVSSNRNQSELNNEAIKMAESNQIIPPPLPNFSSQTPAVHSELALNIPENSMDFSYDYSQVGSMSYEALDEFKTEEEMRAIKEEKKKERRRKRGHGAIDVEVFGIEEMRESRNSSRGQKLVPILNLAGNSSDEDDDFSTQSDTKSDMKADVPEKPGQSFIPNTSVSVSAWERDFIPEEPHFESDKYPDLEESSRSPDTSARPLSDVLSASIVQEPPRPRLVSGSNEDWRLLFDKQPTEDVEPEIQEDPENTTSMDLDQPFLEHILKQDPEPVRSKNRPKSSKSKPVKSKVRQSLDEGNYQRKWARSSTSWSTYNAGELNTSSSLRSSTELTRPSSAPKARNLCNTVSRNTNVKPRGASPSGQPAARSKRPLSADVNKRLSMSTSDLAKTLQASTNSQLGNQNSREPCPYRQGSRSGHQHSNNVSRNEDNLDLLAGMLGPDDDDVNSVDEAENQGSREDSPQRLTTDVEHSQNGDDSGFGALRETIPLKLNLDKDKRPPSAGKSKGKQKQKKKGGNHGNGLDLSVDLVTIDHRLPKPGIMEWLSDFINATSPKSTYDKYLEMTPRIEAGTMSKWQCLPDEILLHVFAYLDQTSLTKCAQVCHQFYRVAMDESLWKYITIKKHNDLDDTCLGEIAKRHPVSLALIQCQGEQVTSKGLRDLFRECSSTLKELNISLCSKGALQGDSLLLHAAARCNLLTHVDTSWCSVTDSGLMAISNTIDRLESLCINGCQAISDDGLETIIKKHGGNLRVLEMFGCFNLSPRGLRCISNNCINLLSINLGNCYKLTDSCIAQLSASLGRVESLDLRGCKQIKDNSIRRVVKNCPRLKSLSLANCPNITDVSLLEISTYLTDIRSIDLCGCKKVTDSSIRALVNTCSSLQEIDISSTGCTHRSVSMIANFCGQRLETLKINFLSDVTEQSLIKLAKHCKRLKSVHMYGCPSVRNMSKIRDERPTFTISM